LKSAAEVVYQHHERPDGRGYPRGLKGEAINSLALIVSVSDAFDAMMTTRAYRPSLTMDVIMSELQEFSGKQFDAKVVSVLVSFMDLVRSDIYGERLSA